MRTNATSAGSVLLVDGGGTKTRAVLVGPDDRRLGEGLAGPSNLMIGVVTARQAVSAACEQALDGAGQGGTIPPLHCAMAGAGNLQLCRDFSAIEPAPETLVTDAFASMIGALGGKPGVGLVVGTGSAGYCLDERGQIREGGGWGLAIGDEGSGAWIGRAAVTLTVKIIDGQGDPVLDGIGADERQAFGRVQLQTVGNSRTDLLEWVRQATPAKFASLTPSIVALAGSGNQVAVRLLEKAGEDLEVLCQALDARGTLPVAMIGGLAPHLQSYLPANLAERVNPPVGDVIDGLLALARGRVPAARFRDHPLLEG